MNSEKGRLEENIKIRGPAAFINPRWGLYIYIYIYIYIYTYIYIYIYDVCIGYL